MPPNRGKGEYHLTTMPVDKLGSAGWLSCEVNPERKDLRSGDDPLRISDDNSRKLVHVIHPPGDPIRVVQSDSIN